MDLKKLFKEKKEALTVWVTFADLFDVELEYTDRRGMERVLERSKTTTFNKKTHQAMETYDDELFNIGLASRIKNWRGLTLGKLAQLTNIDIGDEDPEQEVPFSGKNKNALVGEIFGFNNFIRETMTDLQLFRQAGQEKEIKNSEAS